MKHSISGVKFQEHFPNTTLHSKIGIIGVGKKTATLKWDRAGHIGRMDNDRWAKVTTRSNDFRISKKYDETNFIYFLINLQLNVKIIHITFHLTFIIINVSRTFKM